MYEKFEAKPKDRLLAEQGLNAQAVIGEGPAGPRSSSARPGQPCQTAAAFGATLLHPVTGLPKLQILPDIALGR